MRERSGAKRRKVCGKQTNTPNATRSRPVTGHRSPALNGGNRLSPYRFLPIAIIEVGPQGKCASIRRHSHTS